MEFIIEAIDREDTAGIRAAVRLTFQVWEQMEEKAWYRPDPVEVVLDTVHRGKGIVYRVLEKRTGAMAGVLIVIIPGRSDENLGYDAGFDEDGLLKTAHMDSAAVLPEFRGCGLQGRMADAAQAELRRRGYRFLMCTVHPENRFSLQTMVKQGYRVIGMAEKYGGYERAVLLKELAV